MIEFVLCAPFLMTILVSIFFFTDVNRFSQSANALASVQAWRAAATGTADADGFAESDDISFHVPGGVSLPGPLEMILTYGTIRNAMVFVPAFTAATSPPARTLAGFHAGVLYEADIFNPMHPPQTAPPWTIQGMPTGTFDQRPFQPSGMIPDSADGDAIVYHNSTYLRPLLGAANDFVGRRQDGADDGINEAWNLVSLQIPARQSIIFEPYSTAWGDADGRMRSVDRFTIMRDPVVLAAAAGHSMISGGVVSVLRDLGEVARDTGTDGLIPLPARELFGQIHDILDRLPFFDSAANFMEQSRSLRKVDKRVDREHDIDGDTDWGYPTENAEYFYASGSTPIPENRRLLPREDPADIAGQVE